MKKYLIVGGSKGIGGQLCKQLANDGMYVINMSRTPSPHATENIIFDVLNPDIPAFSDTLNGIVYCPGSINLRPFKALKSEDFLTDLNINTLAAIRILQHYLPSLHSAINPSMILFSTVAVQTGMPYHTSVALAKGAIEGLTRSLAAELAPKVRVNCIAPSLTDTALASRLLDTEQKRSASAERHPLKNIGDSEQIAAMAKFLLSDNASFITGQVIKIDGGISALKV